ncbi:uncharacterized protein SAPINGB_P004300 [Magnusiomyces paraingens]|uniref:Uncharacterized protein n=1 Tax=Magnusiomyces paraingens TaxID=2606893 RepID=A0A5E8BTR8_9ASCO|nr:uncharacterized protein SAPINGB_P004300 [Saprochaete ingens]VVT54863.1 unnamed protein product [Saprochaete ingens]
MQPTLWANIYWDSAWLYAVQEQAHSALCTRQLSDHSCLALNFGEKPIHEGDISLTTVRLEILQKAFAPGTQSPSVGSSNKSGLFPKQLHLDEDKGGSAVGNAGTSPRGSAVETASQSGDDNQDAVDSRNQ